MRPTNNSTAKMQNPQTEGHPLSIRPMANWARKDSKQTNKQTNKEFQAWPRCEPRRRVSARRSRRRMGRRPRMVRRRRSPEDEARPRLALAAFHMYLLYLPNTSFNPKPAQLEFLNLIRINVLTKEKFNCGNVRKRLKKI